MTEAVVKPISTLIAEARRQIQPYTFRRLESRKPRAGVPATLRTVAVTSGKGGVGKTNVVANLGLALSQEGRRVILLDADLGLANIDVMFGIRPKHTLLNVLQGSCTLEQALLPGPSGLRIIAGGSGIPELTALNREAAVRLLQQLRFLEGKADLLLIDTGAGISQTVVSFCLAVDHVLVVTTPEPAALADAYGIIKVICQSRRDSQVALVVNRAENGEEARFIQERLRKVAWDYLQFPVTDLGFIPQDRQMYVAVRQQTPLLLHSPMSPAALKLRELAEALMASIHPEIPTAGIEGFVTRLSHLWPGLPRACP